MRRGSIPIMLMILALTLGLVGCGNSIAKKSIEEAKLLIENKEYDKALLSLEVALDEDRDNEEAKNLYDIVNGYNKVKKVVEGNDVEEAKKFIDEIHSDYVNYAIKEDIDNLKSQIDTHIKEIEDISVILTESENMFNNKQYTECKNNLYTKILGLQGEGIEPNKWTTEEQKVKAEELKRKCDEAIAQIEAEKLAEEARKAEEQRKEEVKNNELTESDAIKKVSSLNAIKYYSDNGIRISFITSSGTSNGMTGYLLHAGINGELKFETIGHYFVDSSTSEVYKMDILTDSYILVNN